MAGNHRPGGARRHFRGRLTSAPLQWGPRSGLARGDGQTDDISLGVRFAQGWIHGSLQRLPVCGGGGSTTGSCELRKCRQKAKTWFGVCLHPSDQSLRFGFKVVYEWQRTPAWSEWRTTLPSLPTSTKRLRRVQSGLPLKSKSPFAADEERRVRQRGRKARARRDSSRYHCG
jgi:hypothetical protein